MGEDQRSAEADQARRFSVNGISRIIFALLDLFLCVNQFSNVGLIIAIGSLLFYGIHDLKFTTFLPAII